MNGFLYNKAAIHLIIVYNGSLVVSAHYNSKINSAIQECLLLLQRLVCRQWTEDLYCAQQYLLYD